MQSNGKVMAPVLITKLSSNKKKGMQMAVVGFDGLLYVIDGVTGAFVYVAGWLANGQARGGHPGAQGGDIVKAVRRAGKALGCGVATPKRRAYGHACQSSSGLALTPLLPCSSYHRSPGCTDTLDIGETAYSKGLAHTGNTPAPALPLSSSRLCRHPGHWRDRLLDGLSR